MTEKENDNLLGFLDALTEISRRYKIGVTGEPILFVMEDDDLERIYSCDAESRLSFDQTSSALRSDPN
jgi:hypothetical protein